jgi:PAS domain S-box-containing protein
MYQGMRKPPTTEAGKRQLQLLLVGGSEQDFANLQQLLVGANDGESHLEHAASPGDILNHSGKGSYDLLLCSGKSADNAAFQRLRQVRQRDSGVLLIFLSDPVSKDVIKAALRAGACHHAQNHPLEPHTNLANAFDAHSAERQYQESEETLRKLWRSVEQSADTLIIMDRSGVMEYVNPAFEALTGYSRQEATGQSLGILKSEQEACELYDEMWKTVLSGHVFRGIVMNRKKNGETLILEKTITPLRDGRGQITHLICTGRTSPSGASWRQSCNRHRKWMPSAD